MDESESFLNHIGNREDFLKNGERHEKDFGYFDKNIEMLRRNYAQQWVAVYNEEIVAHNKNYGALYEQLKKKDIKGRAVVLLIDTRERDYIFNRQSCLA